MESAPTMIVNTPNQKKPVMKTMKILSYIALVRKPLKCLALLLAVFAGLGVGATLHAQQAIAGRIEAESFSYENDIGTEGTGDPDGGGQNVGWTDAGDVIDYSVNVAASGNYDVAFRLAAPDSGKQLQLKSGSTVLATVNVPQTGGWQIYQTVTVNNVALAAGVQTLRVYAVTGGWNFNWMEFTFASALVPDAKILTFGLPNNPAVIDPPVGNAANIAWTVPYESFPSGVLLSPAFTLSIDATCTVNGNPVISGTQIDFTNPVHFIVTSSDSQVVNDYTVTVSVTPASTACDILTFGLPGNAAVISGTNVALTLPLGTNLATLAPVFTKSTFSTCNQTSGAVPSPDFSSGPVHYIVTAQDGVASKDYTVTATVRTNTPPSIVRLETTTPGGSLSTANLTTIGTTDWINLGKDNNTSQAFIVNQKNGGTAISSVASSAFYGGGSLGGIAYDFSDGSPTANATATTQGAMIKMEGGTRFFTVTVDISNQSGTVDIWYASQQNSNCTLSVSDGTSTVTNTLFANYGDGATRMTAHDQIAFDGASGDVLTINYSGSGDYNGRIGMNAIAVAYAGGPGPSDYANWATSKGLSGGTANFDADPDNDGINNGIEFVLGGEPNPTKLNSNSAALLPTGQAVGNNLVFVFTRTDESAYLNPTVEFSTTMMAESWTTAVDPTNATIFVNGGSPADTITVTIPKNGAPALFARLKVIEPTP